ncbi:TlpA family protein disulfide reductase [Salinadaptatus halalkaliphilus]|uniref:TlpA family protein disulfide reductase n=1 Tax=Salinadaptatus halalkaliphilus TaxID=2419781 RepID=A0A4S3TG64_9EURY|nr:redoxin family protein [Salinadaptatus halalkaliphilus]THE62871.1 TlpA family protein disulfide reductase [Salinadaptatus halalkaliphilus]
MAPTRRELVTATVCTLTLTGCLEDDFTSSDDGRDTDDGSGGGTSDGRGDDGSTEPPFDIATIDAPGSEAGIATVPRSDQHLLVNFTRTQCPTSAGALEPIGDARSSLANRYDVGPDGDIAFLSVTDATQGPTPTPAELADWWAEHDGEWPIGIDETGACNDYYDVVGFPTLVAIDPDGEVYWRTRGSVEANNIESELERGLEATRADSGVDSNANASASDGTGP